MGNIKDIEEQLGRTLDLFQKVLGKVVSCTDLTIGVSEHLVGVKAEMVRVFKTLMAHNVELEILSERISKLEKKLGVKEKEVN